MARRDQDPWFLHVGTEMEKLSEEWTRFGPSLVVRKFWEPRVDVVELEDSLLIAVEVAGMRGEEVQVTIQPDQNTLTIRGERRPEDFGARNGAVLHQLEIFYGDFERQINLPDGAFRIEHARATYRNGILIVVVPKTTSAAFEQQSQPCEAERE